MKKITAREFEEKVLKKEETVIRLRCKSDETVDDYDYERQAADSSSMSDWLENRIKPKIGDIECDVIDGNTYQRPHGRTKMEKIRDSYVK